MQPDMQQAMTTATESAMHMMATIMYVGSVLSLAVGAGPILWGQVRVKCLITAMASCVMFGIVGIMVEALFGDGSDDGPRSVTSPTRQASVEIDWGKTGSLVVAIAAFALACWLGLRVARSMNREREEARLRSRQRAIALDPATVARSVLPEMTPPVDEALARIGRLRDLRAQIGRAEDMDALVMIEKRVPSVMGLYLKASQASTETERRDLARTALASVVEIGQMAEDARQRIAGDLRSELDTETRYISSRSGYAGGLRID